MNLTVLAESPVTLSEGLSLGIIRSPWSQGQQYSQHLHTRQQGGKAEEDMVKRDKFRTHSHLSCELIFIIIVDL
jgi:hypothetical protein